MKTPQPSNLPSDVTVQQKLDGVYYRLFETMRNGFAIHEIICDGTGAPIDYRFLDISPSFERLTGLNRSIVGKRVLDVLPDTEPYWIETYGKVALTGESTTITNYSKELGKYFEVTAYQPAPGLFATIFEDVTERKQSEQALVRLSMAMEQAAEVVVITDVHAKIVYVNPAFENVTGYRREDVMGENPRVLQSGVHDESFYKEMWETISSGRTWRGVFENQRKNGARYTERAVISPVMGTDGTIVNYVAVKKDITEDILKEKQLHQAEKMEALGYLSGGIAHDFNNILGAIMGYADLLADEWAPESLSGQYIQQILVSTERAKQLINQILSFTRQQKQALTEIAPQLIVREVVVLLRAAFPSTIAIETRIGRDVPSIVADPIQIHELMMNLCTNGVHAMDERGTLRVFCEAQQLGDGISGRLGAVTPGKYVAITIEDEGCGMDARIIQQMFDPFFTTREVGKGSGMGLSVVFGIMKEHGGNLLVDSEPGKGTCITALFPVPDENTIPPWKPAEGHGRPIQRILLVAGDISSGTMMSRMLRELGFDVSIQLDPSHALEALTAEVIPFDLVIADYRLPGTNGVNFLKDACLVSAPSRVVLLTNHGDREAENSAAAADLMSIWHKPFGKSRLRNLIATLGDVDMQNEN
ncbi:MAG: PAS domain S-box protein [Deltaproteobacteria bacterium]|nr:PAS domain S-box protein [Deltaproteobacteria bacterium]